MCSAIEHQGQKLYFMYSPALPVLRLDGGIEWVQWGLPYGAGMPGAPSGASARSEDLPEEKWRKLRPHSVRIPCQAFMVRDARKAEHWFAVEPGRAVQGALIQLSSIPSADRRGEIATVVYVVTEPSTDRIATVHDRMPRMVPA